MTRLRALSLIAPAVLAASVACSSEPRSASASAPVEHVQATTDGGHSAGAHGDHTPHHGGTVYMKGDLHFEIVLARDGNHRLYFSDAMRAELPAATASDVTLTFSNGEASTDTLKAEVDASGESWIAKGAPLTLKDAVVMARVAFVVNDEPYWIDVPFIEASDAVVRARARRDREHARSGGLVVCLSALAAMLSGGSVLDRRGAAAAPLDGYADRYLNLVADLGALSPESVDFVIDGTETKGSRLTPTFDSVAERSRLLAAEMRTTRDSAGEDTGRADELAQQLGALALRSDLQAGTQVALADEMNRLFAVDLSGVSDTADHGDAARKALAHLLPGDASLSRRLSEYQRRFIVPRGRLHAVITASIAACRTQTRRFLALPEGEALAVEYVADRPWSGYSVYRGNFKSVMQVNRAMPLSIGQALDLACHEGYPGHHTYNSLRDQHVARGRNRPEARALLIFSPDGFYAEAMAAAAASIVFTVEERTRLFREELFPLVGLDPSEADAYAEVCGLIDRLAGATTLAVRRYLSGELSAAEAATTLERDAVMEHPEGLLAYVDRYRGYALAYTWGRDRLLSSLTGPALGEEDRWRLLQQRMTSPHAEKGGKRPAWRRPAGGADEMSPQPPNHTGGATTAGQGDNGTLAHQRTENCATTHKNQTMDAKRTEHPGPAPSLLGAKQATRINKCYAPNRRGARTRVFQGQPAPRRNEARAALKIIKSFVRGREDSTRRIVPGLIAGPPQDRGKRQNRRKTGRAKDREDPHAPP